MISFRSRHSTGTGKVCVCMCVCVCVCLCVYLTLSCRQSKSLSSTNIKQHNKEQSSLGPGDMHVAMTTSSKCIRENWDKFEFKLFGDL